MATGFTPTVPGTGPGTRTAMRAAYAAGIRDVRARMGRNIGLRGGVRTSVPEGGGKQGLLKAAYRAGFKRAVASNAVAKDYMTPGGHRRMNAVKANLKMGGGGGRQRRVPAGSPRGGQWTK